MAYNCPGLSGTVPPLTKMPRGVGALLLGLPHRETVPAAPLIGAPLLNYRESKGAGSQSEEQEKKERKEGEIRRCEEGRQGQKEKGKKKNNKDGERREKHQLIISAECTY